jgi:hypothetical protein
MKSFEPLLDGSPKLRIADIVSSTFHKLVDSSARSLVSHRLMAVHRFRRPERV